MKTNTFLLLLLQTIFVILLSACSGNSKKDDETHANHETHTAERTNADASAPQFQVPMEFQQQLGNVFSNYTALKDALVASDHAKVKSEAASTSQSVAKVDMKLLTGDAHNDWMTYLKPINNSLTEIENSPDLETQREAFSTLSDNLYKSIKAFGLGGKEAFYDFCPMAFNNEGGYWLSESEQIRNPYFGEKMLNCGVVKETLR